MVSIGNVDEDVLRIAKEINRYLVDHPNAADTIEGISKWWLVDERTSYSLDRVRRALEYLIAAGVVCKRTTTGVESVYSSCDKFNSSTRH